MSPQNLVYTKRHRALKLKYIRHNISDGNEDIEPGGYKCDIVNNINNNNNNNDNTLCANGVCFEGTVAWVDNGKLTSLINYTEEEEKKFFTQLCKLKCLLLLIPI